MHIERNYTQNVHGTVTNELHTLDTKCIIIIRKSRLKWATLLSCHFFGFLFYKIVMILGVSSFYNNPHAFCFFLCSIKCATFSPRCKRFFIILSNFCLCVIEVRFSPFQIHLCCYISCVVDPTKVVCVFLVFVSSNRFN